MRASAIMSRSAEESHIDDVESNYQQDVLTSPWSPNNRLFPSPTLSSLGNDPHQHSPSLDAVIQSRQQLNYTPTSRQNVPTLSDCVQPSLQTSQFYRNVLSSQLPSAPRVFPQHAPLNNSPLGLRTTPVFESTSQLATHYGIPHKLPPLPRVNSTNNNKPPVPLFNQHQPPAPLPEPSSSSSSADLQNLMSNYLSMISRNPEDTQNVDQSPAAATPLMDMELAPIDEAAAAAQSVVDLLCSESSDEEAVLPEYMTNPDISGPEWNDYLTSPYDESPFEKLLETPALGTSELDFFTSPVVASADTSLQQNQQDLQLFPSLPEPNDKMTVSRMPPPPQTTPSSFDGLFTMSPYTPSLDPLSLNSPAIMDSPGNMDRPLRSRSKAPTGTRKGVTPETLVPLEAPTQPRNYNGPSATARKALPAVFARKRARSTFEDDDDELADDPTAAPVSQTEEQAIAAKRRQNTLAARRSRKRKLEYQQQLEDELEMHRQEKEIWKARALMYQQHLVALGVQVSVDDST